MQVSPTNTHFYINPTIRKLSVATNHKRTTMHACAPNHTLRTAFCISRFLLTMLADYDGLMIGALSTIPHQKRSIRQTLSPSGHGTPQDVHLPVALAAPTRGQSFRHCLLCPPGRGLSQSRTNLSMMPRRPAATPMALGLAGRLSRKLRRWRPTVASSEGAWKQRPLVCPPEFPCGRCDPIQHK